MVFSMYCNILFLLFQNVVMEVFVFTIIKLQALMMVLSLLLVFWRYVWITSGLLYVMMVLILIMMLLYRELVKQWVMQVRNTYCFLIMSREINVSVTHDIVILQVITTKINF